MSITAIFKNAVKAAGLSLILAFSASGAFARPNSISAGDINNAVSCKPNTEDHGEKHLDPRIYRNLEACIQGALNLSTSAARIKFMFIYDNVTAISELSIFHWTPKAEPISPYCVISGVDKKTGLDQWFISPNLTSGLNGCVRHFLRSLRSRTWNSAKATYVERTGVTSLSATEPANRDFTGH